MYLGFGTITSRIILRQPSLQNLRRVNRNIIVCDPGMKLLYIDYSQFEAGILASMSDDKLLINLYKVDIYSDLAEKVLGDRSRRSDAKIIFYRYMYGDKSLSQNAELYFLKFKKLKEFRQQIDLEISKNQKIGTSLGNYRYSNGEDSTWALSHVVQGTASLIYKNALLRVRQELRRVQFLVPMHDGTLYQIYESEYDVCKNKIEDIYKEEFKKICVQIEPRIVSSEFFQ